MRVLYNKMNKERLIDVAAILSKQYDMHPCYWIGLEKYHQNITKYFPETPFHIQEHSIKCNEPSTLNCSDIIPIDKSILDEMAMCQDIFMNMITRFGFYKPISVHEAMRYYYLQIKYFNAILLKYKPDLFICWRAPHNAFDYLLFNLCKLHSIPTLILWKTSLPRTTFVVNDMNFCFNPKLSKSDDLSLDEQYRRYISKIRGSYSDAMPDYMHGIFKDVELPIMSNNSIFQKYLSNFKSKVNQFFSINTAFHYRDNSNSKLIRSIKYNNFKVLAAIKRRNLLKYYNNLCSKEEVKTDEPYILLALHLEPERTVCPEGGVFANQLLVAEMIARNLPSGWKLYIRENPKQLKGITKPAGGEYRSKEYYNQLSSLPNVKLIPFEKSPFELIDNSKAVATLTGTIGWEAVLRGKPALVFGYAWYRGCEGVFYVPTNEDCKKAMDAIFSGYKVDEEKVNIYIKYIENKFAPWIIDDSSDEAVQDIKSMAKLIAYKAGKVN